MYGLVARDLVFVLFFLLLMFSLFFFHHISLACSLLNVFLLNVFIVFLSLYSFGRNSLTKTVLIL